MNQSLSKTYTDFTNAAKSFISHQMQGKGDEKVTARYIFQNECYFSIFFCHLFLVMSELQSKKFSSLFFFFFALMLQTTY